MQAGLGTMAAKKKKVGSNKSLLELVEEKAGASPLSGKNRAVLMEMKEEIADVLGKGYKWRVVWEVLKGSGRIEMGYDTFRMHCRAMGLDVAPKSYTKGKTAKKQASRKKSAKKKATEK